MTRNKTSRLKLITETDDELIDQFEYNWPILDLYSDSILVDDGITPTDDQLYDGCLVAEKTSGKLWMARKNVNSGAYEKSWISYPWNITCINALPGGFVALAQQGFSGDIAAQRVNSTPANDMIFSQIKIPIDGIYDIWFSFDLNPLGGQRAACMFTVNDSPQNQSDMTHATSGNMQTQYGFQGQYPAKAGDRIGWTAWKSGGNAACSIVLGVTLLSPAA